MNTAPEQLSVRKSLTFRGIGCVIAIDDDLSSHYCLGLPICDCIFTHKVALFEERSATSKSVLLSQKIPPLTF